ncbi:MAG: N-acetyl-gamma-glutamyl-phosphate reductase [Desulfobulbus sp.]|jgi:N-acetyl-gamma-glutamyl-phosphate reductase|uniref:N-acetyl-gamma-glutamyl-phosphate reductase n=1 Tax=Desulfobulbus sp. TaxID=895 RepID=UPI00284DEE6F|nr:N-acetyl-gamma-glutamyl-phosphate reductase [Desulfobulbus sp.]MDR2550209.1 N-acetyl-gamma-glutamyl-phosphate reductase [Desulfobulbus sp.]
MMRVGIVGASGYTGVELARILAGHPDVHLTVATSRQYAGMPLAEVFPNLRKRVDVLCENLPAEELADRADFFFTAVPHKTAMDIVPKLLDAGKKVVDLSADFRIRDASVYEAWYQEHSCPHLLGEAVYGLSELYRARVKVARLTANPGCYPTSVILALAPLLGAGMIDPATLIVDSKSGTSGAGRAASVGSLFCEVTDGFRPYKVGGSHRHIPEIEQELSLAASQPVTVSFTPHLLPISRGILSTIYASLTETGKTADLHALYEQTYRDEPFVRVLPAGTLPATQHVRGSNCCDLALSKDVRTGRLIVMSAIDNIVKGASGQAVQNMNLMSGFSETAGLMGAPFFP